MNQSRLVKVLFFILTFLFLLITFIFISGFIYYKNIQRLERDYSILVLGKGGEGHTAPNLTDVIMVVYFDVDNKKIKTFSLPRDLWIPSIKAKINSAYFYGNENLAKSVVSEVSGIDVDSVVVVDFNFFRGFIDAIGGIEVDVENSFSDTRYPVQGKENDLCGGDRTFSCRYETITFEKGINKMNGSMALKFVRSRNASGDEGTDLAREKRQQRVVAAIVNKVLSPDFYLNRTLVENVYQVFSTNIEYDLDNNNILKISKFLIESDKKISSLKFPEELFVVSSNQKAYDYQYVFLPKGGGFENFKKWIKENLSN